MKARVAVIGCGWWSTYAHLPAIADHPGAQLVALVDPDARRRAAAAAAFGDPATFADTTDLLDSVDIDAAIVAVPHALHHSIAEQVLDRGVHTLLEKPMVLDPAHGRELIALARRRGAELLIDYPWHYNAHALRLRDEIATGQIGRIEYISCLYASTVRELYRGDPEPYREAFGYTVNAPAASTYSDPTLSGGGQGQTQVTHAAALLRFLTGLTPTEIFAFTDNFELPVDLVDTVVAKFSGGAVATLGSTGSVLAGQDEIMRYEIFGDAGHILFDVNRGTASIHNAEGSIEHLDSLPAAQRNPEHAPAHNLIDIVRGTAVNGSPADIGLHAVVFVDAMYRSAAARRPVELPAT